MPGHQFADYILDPFKANAGTNILVTVALTNGQKADFGPFGAKGNNFLTIVATTPGVDISSIPVTSASGFTA